MKFSLSILLCSSIHAYFLRLLFAFVFLLYIVQSLWCCCCFCCPAHKFTLCICARFIIFNSKSLSLNQVPHVIFGCFLVFGFSSSLIIYYSHSMSFVFFTFILIGVNMITHFLIFHSHFYDRLWSNKLHLYIDLILSRKNCRFIYLFSDVF